MRFVIVALLLAAAAAWGSGGYDSTCGSDSDCNSGLQCLAIANPSGDYCITVKKICTHTCSETGADSECARSQLGLGLLDDVHRHGDLQLARRAVGRPRRNVGRERLLAYGVQGLTQRQ